MKENIQWAWLSRYRSQLMGLAMLFVILFHVWLPRSDAFYGLHRIGNVGVDMFLFLSGIGLWFSWSKNPDVKHFFFRRYVRVYPAWLIMAGLFYIHQYVTSAGGGYSPNIWHLIANVLFNWSFWRVDDLTFWYVPAIMMMYTFAPAYMRLISRHATYRWLPALFMLLSVAIHYWPPLHHSVGHVEIFWSRIPIFLLGINCGLWVKEGRQIEGQALWLIIIAFAMSLLVCIELEDHWRGRFPLFLERMVYIPLTVSALMLLSLMLRHTPQVLCRAFALLGTVSLEIYLIHIEFVLKPITRYHLGYWPNCLVVIGVSTLLAWLLHRLVAWMVRPLEQKVGHRG